MTTKYVLKLKPGKDRPIKQGHHWIFSGAVDFISDKLTNGNLAQVQDAQGTLIGWAYVNRDSDITARMVSWGDADPLVAIGHSIANAVALRKTLFKNSVTNCYRVINGEGDLLPGLIVDRYNNVLSMQISTLGMEQLKDIVVSQLVAELDPVAIYEKSAIPSRRQEGLKDFTGVIYGELPAQVLVDENGVKFAVDIVNGHKTGMYLDQREMRALIGELSPGKRVLNCFSYTGGFSLYAAKQGAKAVSSVDIAAPAIAQAQENFELNGFTGKNFEFVAEDVFVYLKNLKELDFDIVILDPPAFAKKRSDVPNAIRGYREINRQAFRKMQSGSWLLTCSCSYHVDKKMFQEVVWQAALDAGKSVRIMQQHRLAADHPLNLFHPEADYLKSLLLYIQ